MLKENWKEKDKFNYSDFNLIIKSIIKLCNKVNVIIPEKYEKLQYRNIKVGDNLSSQKLYFNFDSDLAYNSFLAEQGTPVTIIKSENWQIYEDIYYSDGFFKAVTIKNNEETEVEDIFRYYEGDYISGKEAQVSLKEFESSNDFGIVTEINSNSYFYKNTIIKTEEVEYKKRGDFLRVEDLKEVENILNQICSRLFLNYKTRNWYNMSDFSYVDVNGWCKTINLIDAADLYKYSDYSNKTYRQLTSKTYKQLLYKEV